jgi:hypothetical protein
MRFAKAIPIASVSNFELFDLVPRGRNQAPRDQIDNLVVLPTQKWESGNFTDMAMLL